MAAEAYLFGSIDRIFKLAQLQLYMLALLGFKKSTLSFSIPLAFILSLHMILRNLILLKVTKPGQKTNWRIRVRFACLFMHI